MIHVAYYAGWPAGNSGQRIALEVTGQDGELSSEPGFAQETD
jgi:alkylhydroperoxidase/carboxymuconolactone decarboxylase family protein YurZ